MRGGWVDLLTTRGGCARGAAARVVLRAGDGGAVPAAAAYSAVSFGNARTTGALREVCAAHDGILCDPADALGRYLIGESGTGIPRVGH